MSPGWARGVRAMSVYPPRRGAVAVSRVRAMAQISHVVDVIGLCQRRAEASALCRAEIGRSKAYYMPPRPSAALLIPVGDTAPADNSIRPGHGLAVLLS